MLVDLHGKIKALFFSFVHLYYGMKNAIFVSLFNFVHVLTVSYLMYVARFGEGRTRKSGVTSHMTSVCLITQIKTVQQKRKQCWCALLRGWLSSSSVALSLSLHARYSPPHCRPAGPFSSLSGNHWNQIQVLIIIPLPTDSPLVSETALPLARSAFPRPPRHIPQTARLRPVSPPACSPPPHIPGEEVGYHHLHPRPVDHLELKGL